MNTPRNAPEGAKDATAADSGTHGGSNPREVHGGACEIRTASDGTAVRVNGQLSQESLDALMATVRAYVSTRCAAESDVPMLAIAQRMHGREYYTCGRDKGHDGPHRWPDVDVPGPPAAEWTEADDE